MSNLDIINRALGENQQNVIDLTNPDFDAYPLDILVSQTYTLKKTITVEKRTINEDILVWNHDSQGTWNDNKWGGGGHSWTSWETVETIIETNYNQDGFDNIIDSTKDLWGYLAYGSGEVGDNDSSLETELDRLSVSAVNINDDYFQLKFILDENTANGELVRELGLAKENTGDISSTELSYPIDKNNTLYILYYIKTYLKQF